MRLKIILLFVLITVLSNGVYAQLDKNIKAKLYFTEAQKMYEQGDFENSLKYINKAENTLGATVARTLALKIKVQYNLGNFIKAKDLFDNYTANYMQSASKELNDEVLELFVNIEEAAEAAEADAEKVESEQQEWARRAGRPIDRRELEGHCQREDRTSRGAHLERS